MEAHSANILRKSGRGASRGGSFRTVAHPERGGYMFGPVRSWSRQGVGMSVVGRCAADRRYRVVGQQGGCRAGTGRCGPLGAARAGVELLFRRGRHGAAAVSGWGRSHPRAEPLFRRGRHRAGAGRWERRGPAGSSCSGGAGIESLPFPYGPVASPCGAPVPAWTLCSGVAGIEPPPFPDGAGRIPRTQGLPSSRAAPSGRGPMLRFRTLFVLFCSFPPRRNRRRLQIRGFAAREKRKSCFFIFTL